MLTREYKFHTYDIFYLQRKINNIYYPMFSQKRYLTKLSNILTKFNVIEIFFLYEVEKLTIIQKLLNKNFKYLKHFNLVLT